MNAALSIQWFFQDFLLVTKYFINKRNLKKFNITLKKTLFLRNKNFIERIDKHPEEDFVTKSKLSNSGDVNILHLCRLIRNSQIHSRTSLRLFLTESSLPSALHIVSFSKHSILMRTKVDEYNNQT